jgi:glycosyltransferase 2 family protein
MLVPDEPYIGFVTIAVIFVASTLLGFASSSPAVSASSTPPCWSRSGSSTPRTCWRDCCCFAYLVPFAISLAILGGRELWFSFIPSRQAILSGRVDDTGAGDPSGQSLLR